MVARFFFALYNFRLRTGPESIAALSAGLRSLDAFHHPVSAGLRNTRNHDSSLGFVHVCGLRTLCAFYYPIGCRD